MSENVTITNPELKANLEALRIKESPRWSRRSTNRSAPMRAFSPWRARRRTLPPKTRNTTSPS